MSNAGPTPFEKAGRWLFADRATGRIVVVQAPNFTMWVFLAALAASFVVPAGRAATAVSILQVGALTFWAFDELTRGAIRGAAFWAPARWSASSYGWCGRPRAGHVH